MSKAGTVYFIAETERAHGVHEAVTLTKRPALCTVKSVRVSEYYAARNAGYAPEIVFALTLAEDYHGESRVEYEGKIYNVIRAYEPDEGGVEITAQREDVNDTAEDG